MKDIVEDALQNVDEIERESTDDGPSTDEFRTPVCALVGCGPAGLDRVQVFENQAETADIGSHTIHNIAEIDMSVLIRHWTQRKDAGDSDQPAVGAPLDAVLEDVDLVAVTAHLGDLNSARLARTVCRQLSEDQTVLAVPTIPPEGLSRDSRAIFFELVDAAGTTIPYDLARVGDAFCTSDTTIGSKPVQLANSLIVEWIEDVFATVQKSLPAPCLHPSPISEFLEGGTVSMLYWGTGTRSDVPIELLENAVAHRLCDGDRRTASGGFGFVRFGAEFTLTEFESLENHSNEMLCSDTVADSHWVLCGDAETDRGDDCRIGLLLTDIDPASLSFV